ncbi:MAG: sulfotransferase [Omnitrophica bacterium]|nr:sulfotransferase [Candidatus Omnitrophota bacterium]
MNENKFKIMGIFGSGRSGTSWLGSIVSSHPEVVYRFEPFHGLRNNEKIKYFLNLFKSGKFEAKYLKELYLTLLPANPWFEEPPFFQKRYATRSKKGKIFFYYLAKKITLLSKFYEWNFSPLDFPILAFKEAHMEVILEQLVTKTNIPIVYILRHPCAVVQSYNVGHKKGIMPAGREIILEDLLQQQNPSLAKKFEGKIKQMSLTEKTALLWYMDTERAFHAITNRQNVKIIIYENLCREPQKVVNEVFQHFGLNFPNQTISFLKNPLAFSSKIDIVIDYLLKRGSYYLVYKNSKIASEKWRYLLSSSDRKRILDLVSDSIAFTYGTTFGKWVH